MIGRESGTGKECRQFPGSGEAGIKGDYWSVALVSVNVRAVGCERLQSLQSILLPAEDRGCLYAETRAGNSG